MESEVIHISRESVFDRLQRFGPLPWEQSVRIGATVADCLATAHRRGLVHGCVRPQHVLLGANDQPRLCGFTEIAGPAQPGGSPESIARLMHTAPEVLDGDPPRPAADIYSLAATLHHLVTGHPPFPLRAHDSFASWFIRIVTQPAPALPEHVPPGLRRLIGQALAKDRTERPASAAEFAAGLRRLVPGTATVIPLRRRSRLP
jgi:serine/threonine protein kinase